MSQDNIGVVQGVYAKFGQGDVAGILAVVDDDVVWHFVGRAEDYPAFGLRRGHAGVQAFFAAIAEHEQITEFTPRDFYSDADKVFVLGHAAYRLKRTGKTASSDWAHIFTLRDGKVTGFQEFLDTAQIAAAHRG